MVTFLVKSNLCDVSFKIVQTFSEDNIFGYTKADWLQLSPEKQTEVVEAWEQEILSQTTSYWYKSTKAPSNRAHDWKGNYD